MTWHLRDKRSVEEIAREHDLSPASIHAALTYYYDHRADMDLKMAGDDALIDAEREQSHGKLGPRDRG